MQIFALLIHNGRIVTLEVERGDTVDAVYEMLGEHPTVLPFKVQRVMFEQRHMPRRKGHTLDMYGVELESTLHVVARPPPPTVRLSVGGVAIGGAVGICAALLISDDRRSCTLLPILCEAPSDLRLVATRRASARTSTT